MKNIPPKTLSNKNMLRKQDTRRHADVVGLTDYIVALEKGIHRNLNVFIQPVFERLEVGRGQEICLLSDTAIWCHYQTSCAIQQVPPPTHTLTTIWLYFSIKGSYDADYGSDSCNNLRKINQVFFVWLFCLLFVFLLLFFCVFWELFDRNRSTVKRVGISNTKTLTPWCF